MYGIWQDICDIICGVETMDKEDVELIRLHNECVDTRKRIKEEMARMEELEAATHKLSQITMEEEANLTNEEAAIQKSWNELFEAFMTSDMSWGDFCKQHDALLETVISLQ